MFHLAAAGKPLHDDFANKAAVVDGEIVDVINNMPLVRAFCGFGYEHDRFDATVNRELTARGRSLRYLERLRLTHAAITVVLTVALLAWAIGLWHRGNATTGDVVLVSPSAFRSCMRRAISRGAGGCHPARRKAG